MLNAGIVLSRDTIYQRIWGYDFETSSRSLDVYVGYLRTKTEAGGEPRLLHTVRGVGYVLRGAMSLRWRIAVGLAVIAGIVCAFAATGAYLTTKRQLQNSVDESLVARHPRRERRPVPGWWTSASRPGPGLREPGLPATRRAAAGLGRAARRRRRHDHAVHPRRADAAGDGCRLPDAGDRRHRVPDAHVAMARGRRHPDRARPRRDQRRARQLAHPSPPAGAGGSRRGRGPRAGGWRGASCDRS